MSLSADNKWAIMQAVEECNDLADITWVSQQVGLKKQQILAKMPRGPQKGFFGFGGN